MNRDSDILNGLDIPAERPLSPDQRAALKRDVLTASRIGERAASDRQREPQRHMPRALPLLAALIIGAGGGSVTTALATAEPGAPHADNAELSRVSTQGRPVELTPRQQTALDFSRIGPGAPKSEGRALLMAERGRTAFFRIPTDREPCFAVGRGTGTGAFDIGTMKCWTPTPQFTILDMSPIQASGPGGYRVLAIVGFASDGVKTVAVAGLDGQVIAEAAVEANVYKLTAYPPAGVSALLARDAGGHEVDRVAFTR
jgi:hypothetical protein